MAMIRPGKYDPSKPDIELLDYKSKQRFGLKLEGSGALQVGTISQDDSVHIRNVGKRVGDFDEQRSWKSGRGKENLSDSPEGYWDSNNAWTMTSGHIHQTLLWRFARGLRSCDFFMPDKTHSLTWRPLLGSSLYLSMSWSSSGFAADYARLWVKRVGNPGDLTLKLHSNSGGDPGTVLKTVVVDTTDITDTVSVLQLFNWTGTETLTGSTTYHISIYATAADNKNNHWEVGGHLGGSTGKMSVNGSTWVAAGIDPYYYVADADIARKWFSFFLDESMYVVDAKDDLSTASKLYINGDRGKATSATATTIVQSTKAWATDRWIGAYVKIVRGTGIGQVREITDNDATSLTVATWTLAPDSTSEYIIYGTEWFTEITPAGLSLVSSTPAVINQIVYFPQGGATVRTMVWNAGSHSFEDDAGMVDYIIRASDGNGVRAWGVRINSLYYAAAQSWAASPTNLTWVAVPVVGDTTSKATGMCEKDGSIYVFKEDGVYMATPTSSGATIVKLQSGMEKIPSSTNGIASISHQQFIYHTWLHSLVRIYGSSHDDIGQDWSGWGLPDGREGVFSSLDSYTSLLIAGVDAGEGTSSVLGWDGIGWHELLRGYGASKRIRMVKVQPCQDTRNRMWVDCGGDLIYQEMPFQKGSPRLDSGVRYMHEGVIESAAIDMGTASGLPKYIKELTVYAENLGDGNEIHVDYQVDDDTQTSNWTYAGVAHTSPETTIFLGLSNIRKFAYRLRIQSNDNTEPVDVLGVTPNGYARTPYKMVWTLRCRADNVTSRGRLVKPDMLMRWLLDNARFPGRIEMHSQYELAHKFFVIIHPPRMFPYKPAQNGMAEESVFTIVLEEA